MLANLFRNSILHVRNGNAGGMLCIRQFWNSTLTISSSPKHRTGRIFAVNRRIACANKMYSRYSNDSPCIILTLNCKEFSFDDYDIIGFDLDGTLLRYDLNEMFVLEYELLRKFLVEQKGYDRALLDLTLDWDFLQKGLIIDADNGNILKISADATILRATHGTRCLKLDEIIEIYGHSRKWSVATQFFEDPLSTWNGPLSEKLRTLLDYFDIVVSLVFAQAVDLIDLQTKSDNRNRTYKVWPDILEGLIHIYARENFANGLSGYFNALRSEPDRYLLRNNSDISQWLSDLRDAGKALFLLTGSNVDFANFTASYALGPNWQQLFDCVVCFAKKPGFFTARRPFLPVVDLAESVGNEIDLESKLPLNATYTQGNWTQLVAALSEKVDKLPRDVRSVYVGDNLIQDIYTPAKHGLETVVLCEEMLADECTAGGEAYPYREAVGSKFWGSYFSVDNTPTLWADIISKYSSLCVPRMDTVARMTLTNRFFCENTHGYYPKAPEGI